MPFPIAGHVPIPPTDLLTWIFDKPQYDLDKPIFISAHDTTQSFSYAQSLSLVCHLIAGLRALGLKPGDCVVIHSFNSVTYPLLVLAIIGAGGVFAGTNPSYTPHELSHTLRIAKAKFVLAEPELLEPMHSAMSTNRIPPTSLFVLDTEPNQSVPASSTSWRTLLSHGTASWTRFPASSITSRTTTAAFFFSSGTTGLPKATQITHYNLIAQHTLVYLPHPRPYPISVVLCIPMFHIGIGPLTFCSQLKDGRTAYVMRRFELQAYLQLHTKHRVTELLCVPPIVNAVVGSGLADPGRPEYRDECSLKSLRYGLIGAAPLSPDMQRKLQGLMGKGARLGQLWGMTELTCIATFVRPRGYGGEEVDHIGSVGTPVSNVELKIVDDEGKDVSTVPDVRGEIYVRGPTVMRGYFENEKANIESFDKEGYLKSGDIGYVDSKTGLWYIVDRRKELIKVRGFQVAPAELEEVLLMHPRIADAAVIGVKDAEVEASELPRAYVVRKTTDQWDTVGMKLGEREVKRWVAQRLAKYKSLDGGVAFVDFIPKNASGKILKRTLRDWAKEESSRPESKL